MRSPEGYQVGERARNVHFYQQREKRIQKGGDNGRGQAGRRATLCACPGQMETRAGSLRVRTGRKSDREPARLLRTDAGATTGQVLTLGAGCLEQ